MYLYHKLHKYSSATRRLAFMFSPLFSETGKGWGTHTNMNILSRLIQRLKMSSARPESSLRIDTTLGCCHSDLLYVAGLMHAVHICSKVHCDPQ